MIVFAFFAVMKKILVSAAILIFPLILEAQNYPKNYFIIPLDPPIYLTGTFGEIRANHLHSGIDLGTDDLEGLPVMASADGYVSRVKISSDGYGKALYVTHPNGYVTVYAHLQKFTAPVNALVRKMQYEKQVFELDFNPKAGEFPVKQREVIAYSGNSGSSTSPHLHFEIRDEVSEEPINPFLFGINIMDTIPPEILYVRIYPERGQSIVNFTDSAETYEVLKNEDGIYMLNASENPTVFGTVGFGIGAIDKQYFLWSDTITEEEYFDYTNPPPPDPADTLDIDEPPSPSPLGIYSAEMFIDDVPTFSWRYDRFSFTNTRDVNGHIDYRVYHRSDRVIERCHRLSGDYLPIYGESNRTGYIKFNDNETHQIKMVVRDFKGNSSQIEFQLTTITSLGLESYQQKPDKAVFVSAKKGVAIHKSNFDVVLNEGSVYEDFYYSDEVEKNNEYISDVFTIGDSYEPVRTPFKISIKPKKDIDSTKISKVVMVRIAENGFLKPYACTWDGKFFVATTNSFGPYALAIDTIEPIVEKYYVPADMNSMYGGMAKYRIKDELSGIKSYSGTIDGKWTVFEYDKKDNMLSANVDPVMSNQYHDVELTITDMVGNTTVWKSKFYY